MKMKIDLITIGTIICLTIGMIVISDIVDTMRKPEIQYLVDINEPLIDNIDRCKEHYSETFCFTQLTPIWLGLTESAQLHYGWKP